jgi:hypothetical protein
MLPSMLTAGSVDRAPGAADLASSRSAAATAGALDRWGGGRGPSSQERTAAAAVVDSAPHTEHMLARLQVWVCLTRQTCRLSVWLAGSAPDVALQSVCLAGWEGR